jgi:DNA-binding HxlR family transcriptional regulator
MSNVTKRSLTNQWTLRIAHALRNGPLRFCRAVNSPNPPMLTTHLKKMARDGLVDRVVIELGPPANVEYRLTQLGQELAKPASALVTWVDRNMP